MLYPYVYTARTTNLHLRYKFITACFPVCRLTVTDTRGHANSTEAVLTIQSGDELVHEKKPSIDKKKESGKTRKSKKTTTTTRTTASTTARAISTLTDETSTTTTTSTTSVTTTTQGAPVKLDAQTPSTTSEETSTFPPAGTRCYAIRV